MLMGEWNTLYMLWSRRQSIMFTSGPFHQTPVFAKSPNVMLYPEEMQVRLAPAAHLTILFTFPRPNLCGLIKTSLVHTKHVISLYSGRKAKRREMKRAMKGPTEDEETKREITSGTKREKQNER
jgi:hypothetical protein